MTNLTESQIAELTRLQAWFPYRIVFGVIRSDTGAFEAWAKTTMHSANKLAKAGHNVTVLSR